MTAGWGASYPDHWPSPIPIPKPNPNQLRRLLGCLGFASRLDTSPYADLLSEELWGRAAKSFETESLALLGEAKESPLRLCVEAGAPRRPAIVSRATVSRAIVSISGVQTSTYYGEQTSGQQPHQPMAIPAMAILAMALPTQAASPSPCSPSSPPSSRASCRRYGTAGSISLWRSLCLRSCASTLCSPAPLTITLTLTLTTTITRTRTRTRTQTRTRTSRTRTRTRTRALTAPSP